jgi:uncharacterized membrane protein
MATVDFHSLTAEELEFLAELRKSPPAKLAAPDPKVSAGQHVADRLTALVGSWRFILIQSGLLVLWIAANIWAWLGAWDPYPFILLNLALSFQAAYTAPIIMMSQNRLAESDRRAVENDYRINVKAELEIELLHQKIDLMREREVAELIRLVAALERRLDAPMDNAAASPRRK